MLSVNPSNFLTIDFKHKANIVYKGTCSSNESYIGETKRNASIINLTLRLHIFLEMVSREYTRVIHI